MIVNNDLTAHSLERTYPPTSEERIFLAVIHREESVMKAAVLHRPRDVRFEERDVPKVVAPTDAVIRLSATCICGSDLWPYRGIQAVEQPTPMGHEYCGIVEDVGREVRSVKPGQFVIGSFFASDNTCPHCKCQFAGSWGHPFAGSWGQGDGANDQG